MWPMLLNLTHDECRRTLRRLELEAYANMISVFRAQGALEDNRKKLLEELRAVLHISSDRHSAEARRVSNDELLATIAHHLTGPNTGLGWISEGRRRVPLMPRGIPQTAYTEIADRTAEAIKEENKEILKNLEAEKLIAPKSSEEELPDHEGETAESVLPSNDMMDEMLYPPVAMEDQTSKLWETELINRKRKIPEGGSIPDECTLPTKNMRNIPVNTNQKHLNLSQIYSKYTQPATNKSSGQSKHSYNQVSKVSTSKSSQPHQPRSHKHRSHRQNKNAAHMVPSKSQMKKAQEVPESPGKQFNPGTPMEYAGPPGSFQASYTQSILGGKTKPNYMDDMKPKVLSSPGMVTESPTMQLLAQPAAVPHELRAPSSPDHPGAPPHTPLPPLPPLPKHARHPQHVLVKGRRPEQHADKKVQISEMKILQKPTESGIKVLSNRQVVVAPGSTQKALNTPGKVVTTKVVSAGPRPPPAPAPVPASAPLPDKMIIVSKPQSEHKNLNSKIIITSSAMRTPSKEATPAAASVSPRPTETFTPKGIPATDLKVSAKTFVLNQKPGQKMVVLPAKARTKAGSEMQLPLIHFKGIPTGMKLVPVSSQSLTHVTKSPAVTVVSKPLGAAAAGAAGAAGAPAPAPRVLAAEPIKTANLADIVPVKGLTPVTTTKMPNPIVRPASAKGSVIVVQKGATIGKSLSFTKNGNDMTKIIMGKNVNQHLQAAKSDQAETSKCPGNVIVLELNNDQPGRATTMSEILDSRSGNPGRLPDESKKHQAITQDTPVLFDAPAAGDRGAAVAPGALGDIGDPGLAAVDKDEDAKSLTKDSEGAKDSSSVTDWEMELDTVSRKGKDEEDKLNSLHLDLGMSSDSEGEYMVHDGKPKAKHSQEATQRATPSGERSELYGAGAMSIATRTLLSQLQDEGSSSNDSSFALKSKADKSPAECDALSEAKEKLTEKVAEARSRHKRIDVFSTAISSADINLDAFGYLDENIMAGDDERAPASPPSPETHSPLDKQ